MGAAFTLLRRLTGWSPRWATAATQRLTLRLPIEQVLRDAQRAIETLPLKEQPTWDEAGHSVYATVRGGRKTYCNSVTVSVQPETADTVGVLITSKPVTPQITDWGLSRSIVKRVATQLMEDQETPS